MKKKLISLTFVQYYNRDHRISLNGKRQIITLELSKVDEVIEKPAEEMSIQESWAVYFRYLNDKEKRSKINDILDQEEGIAMASEVLINITKDEVERAKLFSVLKYELDSRSFPDYERREGRKEIIRDYDT